MSPYCRSLASPTPCTALISAARRRLAPRHVDQGLVGEDHIGRDALRLGEFGPARRSASNNAVSPAAPSASAAALAAARAALRLAGLSVSLRSVDLVGALEHAPAGVGHRPGAVAGDVERDDAGAVELAENRPPFLLAVFLADAEGRQAIMAEFQDRVGVLADEHVGQVLGAEALAGAHDGGERLLRRDRAVDHLGAVAAEIAIAARLRGFAEIGQQRLPAAARRFAQRDQRVEPLAVDALLLVRRVALVDLHAAQPDVAHAVERQRIGGQAVAAGAADLLIIALDIGRHVGVKDEADVRLVDAHAERHGRDHDDAVLLQENILVARARRRLHAGVIGQRLDAVLAQEIGKLLGLAPRGAIDDAALPAMAFDEFRDLFAAAGLCLHRQAQIGPVEAVHEHSGRAAEKLLDDIRARRGVGRRGERDGLHAAKLCLHLAERRIFRTEVVAPLRDAMRLVDRQQRDLGALEQIERFGSHQAFGRDVDEAQFAARDAIEHRAILGGIVRGVERRRRNAVAAKLRHLIAHQRDQRRHHDGRAVAQQRRELIAQRLAAARRHHREHVAALKNRGDDLGLAGPEGLEAEGGAQGALRRREVGHRQVS